MWYDLSKRSYNVHYEVQIHVDDIQIFSWIISRGDYGFCFLWAMGCEKRLEFKKDPPPPPLWAIITHLVRLSRVSKTLLGQLGLDKLDKLRHQMLISSIFQLNLRCWKAVLTNTVTNTKFKSSKIFSGRYYSQAANGKIVTSPTSSNQNPNSQFQIKRQTRLG